MRSFSKTSEAHVVLFASTALHKNIVVIAQYYAINPLALRGILFQQLEARTVQNAFYFVIQLEFNSDLNYLYLISVCYSKPKKENRRTGDRKASLQVCGGHVVFGMGQTLSSHDYLKLTLISTNLIVH